MKEKENYKYLLESKSNLSKEEDLNKTIDFFKLENVKLCDQMIKLCGELKKKDENWIKNLKLCVSKCMTYFDITLNSKIKTHIENKFALLDEKMKKLLAYVNII